MLQDAAMTVNAHPSPSLSDAHKSAMQAANCWRGHCIDWYARIDEALIDTLRAIAASHPEANAQQPALFGQRVEAVRCALSGDLLPRQGGAALKALDAIDEQLKSRNLIVHATGSILITRYGDWAWRYRFTPNGKAATLVNAVLDMAEANALEDRLAARGRSLCAHLKNFRKALRKPDAPAAAV